MQEKSDRKVELMFEKLLNKQGITADVPNPSTEVPCELATVENGLVLLQDSYYSKEETETHRPAVTGNNLNHSRSVPSSIKFNGDGRQ
jgi:hypothetical protein